MPFRLTHGTYVVGRANAAQIVIADATVSRRHCALARVNASLTIQDLGSTSGTFVNGIRVVRSHASLGSCLRFGAVTCLVSSSPLFNGGDDQSESTRKLPYVCRRLPKLTDAQQRVIDFVLNGFSEAEIALLLNKSEHTVHTHLKAIYRRFGVHSRTQLMAMLLNRNY